MTVTVTVSTLDIDSSPQEVAAVCRRLRQAGWAADLIEYEVLGEVDRRLVIAPPRGAVAVELLCPTTGGKPARRWYGVRVRSEDERTVWCGPRRPCSATALGTFLEDLATRTEPELQQRHRCRG